jgi:hypothetical protein
MEYILLAAVPNVQCRLVIVVTLEALTAAFALLVVCRCCITLPNNQQRLAQHSS